MSTGELTVSFLCLVAGYALVNWLLNRGGPRSSSESGAAPPPQVPPAAPTEGEPWHQTLGVAPSATREQITAAYRGKISQYHPDKVAKLGPEIRALAEQKSAQINLAYDRALRSR